VHEYIRKQTVAAHRPKTLFCRAVPLQNNQMQSVLCGFWVIVTSFIVNKTIFHAQTYVIQAGGHHLQSPCLSIWHQLEFHSACDIPFQTSWYCWKWLHFIFNIFCTKYLNVNKNDEGGFVSQYDYIPEGNGLYKENCEGNSTFVPICVTYYIHKTCA
jgi:hypothetical protein